MKEKIIDFLRNISPKWRARRLREREDYLTWVKDEYPNVDLNIAIQSLISNTSPYCAACGSPVNTFGKNTCSKKCAQSLIDQKDRVQRYKKAMTEKYGVDNPAKLESSQKKRIETIIKKYGRGNSEKARRLASERAKNLNQKGRKTLKEKYNVTNPGQLPNHRKKSIETLEKNYGVDHYFKSEEFQEISLDKKRKYFENLDNSVDIVDIFKPTDLDQFENPNVRIRYTCKTCDLTEILPSETFKWRKNNFGEVCRKCNNILNGSYQENKLREFIESLGVSTVNNKKILDGKEIDIFVPDYNIGVEYNGLYWHSEERVGKQYHLEKTILAESKEIKLIHIFEDEWLEKPDIVKSRLKSLFGMSDQRIFARKCKIQEISSKQANQFIKNNHIQGTGRSNIKLGLYYNNQLVSVMTFLKGDLSKNIRGWELNRFCSIPDTNVVGAGSRLFNYFTKKYKPENIISFADRRWSNKDAFYTKLGFVQDSITVPNYWYFKPNEMRRYHRYGLRKPAESLLIERELRYQEGWRRIYDCGSIKYIWREND